MRLPHTAAGAAGGGGGGGAAARGQKVPETVHIAAPARET